VLKIEQIPKKYIIFASNTIAKMTNKLIARHEECEILRRCMSSDESEFVIVCGRRRIGKTFLVEQFFEGKYDFRFVGGHNLRTRSQLNTFAKALKEYSGLKFPPFKDWIEAFDALEEYLGSLPKDKRKVIFIDEMPWIDSRRSNFISALEYFWNGWAAQRGDIVLVATGSATSWMTDKLIKNRGGLHNRIRYRIYLKPFNLKETEEYLISLGINWDRYQILQAYMLSGGVPYYLKMLNPELSLAQNIDQLCFSDTGQLRYEFDELYNAIFVEAESYIDIVKKLSENKSGLTRSEICERTNLSGSFLSRILTNLERCNFIDKFYPFGSKKTPVIYRLTDFYTLFYFKFIEHDKSKDDNWWTHHLTSAGVLSWMGFTFENICLLHHKQIKNALGISGMATEISTWRSKADEENNLPGAQIDLIIERADRIIHLCEIKFSKDKYVISKEYEDKVRDRSTLFKLKTKTTKSLVNTFITTFGVANGKHHSIVDNEITMDNLFT
jgi:AAA+ ATPase superfamily predicted ATPase